MDDFNFIDVHHHVMPEPHYRELHKYLRPNERAEPHVGPGGVHGFKVIRDGVAVWVPNEGYVKLEQHIKDMDKAGVKVAILSLGAWQEWNTLDKCRLINDEIAKMVNSYPDRLIGLAHIPIHEDAVEELDRAVKDLGLRGVCITTHYNGRYPDEEIYEPLYRKVNELGVPIFIHPASTPANSATLNKYGLSPTLGRVLDNGLVTCRILFSNILDRFQNIRFVISHLGGSFLFVNSYPNLDVASGNYKTENLKRLFFDTAPALHREKLIEAAIDFLGVGQIVFGSDYPALRYDLIERGTSLIKKLNINDGDKHKIAWENAARLFNVKT